jgi:hypothetical protein
VRTEEDELVTELSVTMRQLRAITALTKAIGAKMQNALKSIRWTFLPSWR